MMEKRYKLISPQKVANGANIIFQNDQILINEIGAYRIQYSIPICQKTINLKYLENMELLLYFNGKPIIGSSQINSNSNCGPCSSSNSGSGFSSGFSSSFSYNPSYESNLNVNVVKGDIIFCAQNIGKITLKNTTKLSVEGQLIISDVNENANSNDSLIIQKLD